MCTLGLFSTFNCIFLEGRYILIIISLSTYGLSFIVPTSYGFLAGSIKVITIIFAKFYPQVYMALNFVHHIL